MQKSVDEQRFIAQLLIGADYPIPWYGQRATLFVIALLSALLALASQLLFDYQPSLVIRITAIAALVVGNAYDIYTTHRLMRLKPLYEQRNLSFPFYEDNRSLPTVPTLYELLGGIPLLVALAAAIVAFVWPLFGLGYACSYVCAGLNNRCLHQQGMDELNLFDRLKKKRDTSRGSISEPSRPNRVGDSRWDSVVKERLPTLHPLGATAS